MSVYSDYRCIFAERCLFESFVIYDLLIHSVPDWLPLLLELLSPWKPKPVGFLDAMCFHSPNSQKAVQILSGSSEAQHKAGLTLRRLHHGACLRPWRQHGIMHNWKLHYAHVFWPFFFFSLQHFNMKRTKTYWSPQQGPVSTALHWFVSAAWQRGAPLSECTDKLERFF